MQIFISGGQQRFIGHFLPCNDFMLLSLWNYVEWTLYIIYVSHRSHKAGYSFTGSERKTFPCHLLHEGGVSSAALLKVKFILFIYFFSFRWRIWPSFWTPAVSASSVLKISTEESLRSVMEVRSMRLVSSGCSLICSCFLWNLKTDDSGIPD